MEFDKSRERNHAPCYGSDVIVDILKAQQIRFVALNPGASFRGLHDSLANSADEQPEIILVPHEKVAIGIAHGYAKATGRMMAAITHDLVGLLHGTMGVYYAYTDRVPVLILGGAGPMDAARRRPWIDWIHTANVQNTAVREFTKWDDHPYSVAAMPDSLERARRIATSEPCGPVYIALDADLQEQEVVGTRPAPTRTGAEPSRISPDPDDLQRVAEILCAAKRPMIVAGSVGRDPEMWSVLVELAETLAAGVVDTQIRHNFPNRHPLNMTGSAEINEADALLLLDVKDIGRHTQLLRKETRGDTLTLPHDAKVLDIGFGDIGISAWSADYGSLFPADVRVVADTSLALPQLLDQCRKLIGPDHNSLDRQDRRDRLAVVHDELLATWQRTAESHTEGEAMSTPHLVMEVGKALEAHDWVLTAGTGNGWATRLWNFDKPDKWPGGSLGTATQIGISLGVALAYRGTGRLVVDLQPDGDLMFDAGALWVAAHHRIPMLVLMVNNRAYNNDWQHQKSMAKLRGNPVENAALGITIDDPAPDFAGLARSFGWQAHGPVLRPEEIGPAVAEAISSIRSTGQPALVDIVCKPV